MPRTFSESENYERNMLWEFPYNLSSHHMKVFGDALSALQQSIVR